MAHVSRLGSNATARQLLSAVRHGDSRRRHHRRSRPQRLWKAAFVALVAASFDTAAVAAFAPSRVVHGPFRPSVVHSTALAARNGRRQHRRSENGRRNNSNSNSRNRSNSSIGTNRNNRPKRQHTDRWLVDTTRTLLNLPSGTLGQRGKYHQLISMFDAWEKRKRYDPDVPLQMERILQRLVQEQQTDPSARTFSIPIDVHMYNQLLDSWACAAHFRTHAPHLASQRAREILVMLQRTYEAHRPAVLERSRRSANTLVSPLQPNARSFDCVFHVVCKVEGPRIARRVLHWMEYLDRVQRNVHAKPKPKQYVTLLDAIVADPTDRHVGKTAEGLLRHMEIIGIQPNTHCYNLAIKAWMRQSSSGTKGIGRQAAEQVDAILEDMTAPKDIITYSSAITAWALSGMQSHAVARVEEILRELEQDPDVQPNTIVLNAVMSAWVKSKNPVASQRTAELLSHMERNQKIAQSQHRNRNSVLPKPDIYSYNTHIHALNMHATNDPNAADQAYRMLLSMEDRYSNQRTLPFGPNRFTYNLVIEAYAKQSSWKAVKVLRQLIDHPTLQPDTTSFNRAFAGLACSARPGSAHLAEELLEYMEQANKLGILPKAKPDVWSYTYVIIAWSRDADEPNAAEKAEAILHRMEEPNRNAYNAVISCWAGRGTLGARRAEALLQEMEETAGITPNFATYNAVLKSWAKSGTLCCGRKAETYLNLMWAMYQSGQYQVRPDADSFNTVIRAISKTKDGAKGQKALRLLRRMDKLYQGGYKEARPDEVTYTYVLSSCAIPADEDKRIRLKALDTAMFTLNELRASRYGAPNQVTYATFLKACATLLNDDEAARRRIIKTTFRQACHDGQVGDTVLTQLRRTAPDDLYQELLAGVGGNRVTQVEDLPLEWRRNVARHTQRHPNSMRLR